jgi:1,4-dihydroxy-2-naphthoate octaprenyltransferase
MNKLTVKDWIIATRPWSFTASALPALVAMLYEIYAHPESAHHWYFGIAAIIGAVIFHAGGNLISDYYDYVKGVDQAGKMGGTKALTSGLFTPRQFIAFGWTFIITGTLLGLFLVWQTGLTLLWIGLFGTIGALFYYRFKANALGDLLIYLVYGPTIMLGTGFVVLGYIDWNLLIVTIPQALIVVGVLHANNTRDIASDRAANVRTLAMFIGVPASKIYYYLLIGLAYVSVVAMVVLQILPIFTLIMLITLPLAIKNCKAMSQISEDNKAPIYDLEVKTAQLHLPFSLTLVVGLVISILIK